MTASVKPWPQLTEALSVELTDKLFIVDRSDTTEGAEGTVKIAEMGTVGTVFAPFIAEAETAENNATSQANAAAASAAAAAAIVNISSVQTFTNPLRRAIRVAMTAAASGSNGIQTLSNVQNSDGILNFTKYRKIFLPTTRPAANQILAQKHDGSTGWILRLLTTGILQLQINAATYNATVALDSATNVVLDLAAVVVRETASVDGSVSFYNQGVQVGTSVAITAGTPASINNSSSEYVLGTSSTRLTGEFYVMINYNRAVPAAELLSLSINGPANVDLNASQVGLLPESLDFTSGWNTTGTASITDANTLTLPANGDSVRRSFSISTNKRYLVRLKGTTDKIFRVTDNSLSNVIISTVSAGSFDIYLETSLAATGIAFRNTAGSATVIDFDICQVVQIGITGMWNAADAQSNTGQVFDASGNKQHSLLPASGATIIGRPESQPQQVRWTNTWAETHELQYIGGVNQAILPAKAHILSIVGVITTTGGSGVQDIIVGDGSDTDRYVAITTGLAAGTRIFTLTATPFTDGTNLKLTVDPDANCTMSIAWTITYTTLE